MSKSLLRPFLICTGVILAVTGPFPKAEQEAESEVTPDVPADLPATQTGEWLSERIDLSDFSFAMGFSASARP